MKFILTLILLVSLFSSSYAIPLTKDNTDKSKRPELFSVKNPRGPNLKPEVAGEITLGTGRNAIIIPPAVDVAGDLITLAQNILTYNAPSFTKNYKAKNFMGNKNVTAKFTSKVCVKNKTLTAGIGDVEFTGMRINDDNDDDNDEEYDMFLIITSDSEHEFGAGVKVGAKMSSVKSYLKSRTSQENISDNPGHLSIKLDDARLDFLYENDRITQISYYMPPNAKVKSTWDYINSQAAKMKLRVVNSPSS